MSDGYKNVWIGVEIPKRDSGLLRRWRILVECSGARCYLVKRALTLGLVKQREIFAMKVIKSTIQRHLNRSIMFLER